MDWLSIKEFLKDSIKYVIVIFVILFVISYVISITQVVGSSMNPTLSEGQVLFLNKFIYHFSDIKRGDIVSLEYADTKYLIKRVVGLPGEKIDIINNVLYINDKVYQEDYLANDLEYKDFHISDLGYDKIPDDMYFVLGDNRENSLDSREIGVIAKDNIKGKIALRFWPFTKIKFF